MGIQSLKYHQLVAEYFTRKLLYLDEPTQKKPNTRKLVEQPWQQTKGEMWDEVTNTLCNLDFIQAKACAKLTYDLVKDYHFALNRFPEYQPEKEKEHERQEITDKYIRDLIDHAEGKITIQELEIPASSTPWTQEKIDAEIERIKTNPTRVDRLNDFINFLGQEVDNLDNYANEFPHFTTQQAWNWTDSGPVGKAAEEMQSNTFKNLILRSSSTRPVFNKLPQVLKIIKSKSSFTALCITIDGRRAITGFNDGNCVLWDLTKGIYIKTFKGHTGSVINISIAANGKRAISSAMDGSFILWDVESGELLKTFSWHSDCKCFVSLTSDGRQAVGVYNYKENNGEYILWNLDTGEVISRFTTNRNVNSIALTPDGKQFISADQGEWCGGVSFLNIETNEIIENLYKGSQYGSENNPPNNVSITPDLRLAIAAYDDSRCILWDLVSRESLITLKGLNGRIYSVSITPDGMLAVSGSEKKYIVLWDLNTGKALKTLKGHLNPVLCTSITPDGRRAISISSESCIVWDIERCVSYKTQLSSEEDTAVVEAVSVAPDGKYAVSMTLNTCVICNLDIGKMKRILRYYKNPFFNSISITPDKRRVITSSEDTIILWDLETGKMVMSTEFTQFKGRLITITPSGRRAITWQGQTTCVWDLNSMEPIKILKESNNFKNILDITPDGKIAIISAWGEWGKNKHPCLLWNLNTSEELKIRLRPTKSIKKLTITPDGRQAISISEDGECILWDLRNGEAIKKNIWHSNLAKTVSISTDGTLAISVLDRGTFILWDIKKEKKMALFTSFSKISSAIFFHEGVFGGEESGEIFIVNLNKELLYSQIGIVTIKQIWDFETQKYQSLSVNCPLCGLGFVPTASVLETIETITKKADLSPEQSPCFELPQEVWEDPGLLGNCPKCNGDLKFNPFIVGEDDVISTNITKTTQSNKAKELAGFYQK